MANARLRTAVRSCARCAWPVRYARYLSESQLVTETAPVRFRKLEPQGFGEYEVKVHLETGGLGGGNESLGHTGEE